MIPTSEECRAMMERYEMLDNIKAHSIKVEEVARTISNGLVGAGLAISLEKVTAGALLHDIGKTSCLRSGEDHAAKGVEICIHNGLGEIADIVGGHIRIRGFKPDGVIDEEEIVYYADKRVNHDRIVTIDERLGYLIDRYGMGDAEVIARIRQNIDHCRGVEKKIFSRLDFGPGDLSMMIDPRQGLQIRSSLCPIDQPPV